MVVNKLYTVRFLPTLSDIMSVTDYVTIVFPTGTSINGFSAAGLRAKFAINTATSSYVGQQLTVFFTGTGT